MHAALMAALAISRAVRLPHSNQPAAASTSTPSSSSSVIAARLPSPVPCSGTLRLAVRQKVSMFSSPAALFGSLLFGAIGFGAFMYGKRMTLWKPMVIGLALMAYPYLVTQTWALYSVGCALCLGLFVFRD